MQENDLKFEHSNKIHISTVNSWTNVISARAMQLISYSKVPIPRYDHLN